MAPPRPGPLSPPPATLANKDIPTIAHAAVLYRIHSLDKAPAFWGRTGRNRFDAPAGEFGVLYAATDSHAAFIETFGDVQNRTVTVNSLAVRGWARVEPSRELRLVDLTGPGLARIGADERLCSGEHDVAQQWSRALWAHPTVIDGLLYRTRHDPSRVSVALFDRTSPAVTVAADGGLMDLRHLPLLGEILETYQFSII